MEILFLNYYAKDVSKIPFTSLIDIRGGGTPKTDNPSFWNGDIPFFTPKDVNYPYVISTEKHITSNGLSHCNSELYSKGTVFITARGTVGKVCIAGVAMAMNQSCYALVSPHIDSLLVYFYASQAIKNLRNKASGAVFDAITTKDFHSESIKPLSPTDANEFLTIAGPIYQKILNNVDESNRLRRLRDALLPRLMSGQIDIPNI